MNYSTFILLLLLVNLAFTTASGQKIDNSNEKILELMQGTWVHDQDSLALISIINYSWTFAYEGIENEIDDNYSITITDKLPEFIKETEITEFVILTSDIDTLNFEILGLTKYTFSTMHFPSGRINLYRKKE